MRKRAKLLGGPIVGTGILGFALLVWTPKTAQGIIVYAVLFAALAVIAFMLFSRKGGNGNHVKSETL